MPQLHQGLSLRGGSLPVLKSEQEGRPMMEPVKRLYREFHYKDAHFHILTEHWERVTERIISLRHNLEAFIRENPCFQTSLKPLLLETPDDLIPGVVLRMQTASKLTGIGPMAAVAGTMAQEAGEISIQEGSTETLIENGGDIYIQCISPLILGLYAGPRSPFRNLALKIEPEMTPLAVCTSSGRMGHSLSFGDCDLVTVFSKDGALADAAATLGGNLVREERDIEPALNRLMSIPGIQGAIIIRDRQFGTAGKVPELIKTLDPDLTAKVSRDDESNFVDPPAGSS